ncbi:hypothetical protein T265_15806, partial [Opisthorchis viverrini]
MYGFVFCSFSTQLNVMVPRNTYGAGVEQLRQQVAIVQHHDAVTGTEQQHVADDYVWRLNNAALPCKEFIGQAIGLLMVNELTTSTPWNAPKFCNERNISLCSVTDEEELSTPSSFRITLYNPLPWEIPDIWLRVPIHLGAYSTQVRVTDLSDPDSCKITHQLLEITNRTRSIPERQMARSSTDMDLVFRSVSDCAVPALGFRTYQVDVTPNIGSSLNDNGLEPEINSNARMLFKLSAIKTGVQIKATHRRSGKNFAVNVEMMYYRGSTSDGVSGAYIFHPKGEAIKWTAAETEVYSSGRQLIRRIRTTNLHDPIASNYYPVINRILIKGAGETSPESPPLALAVYTDRPQGGSSLEQGQLELMVHRRLVRDDGLGVNEALMEQGVDNH